MKNEKLPPGSVTKKHVAQLVFGLTLLSLLIFRKILPLDEVLFTTDDNIGALAFRKFSFPYSFWNSWMDIPLLGSSGIRTINWTNLLVWLLPLDFFVDWIHAIDLSLGSLFFALFLRMRGLSWASAILGCLTCFWLGTTFTLTYAGHIGKFGVVLFSGMYLWFIEKAIQPRSVSFSVLAGGALGAMFLEQQDVGLFFAMPLGLYAVYGMVRDYGWRPLYAGQAIFPIVLIAALIAFHSLWSGYNHQVKGITSVDSSDPEAKWNFVTQWSLPPEDLIDFIAPGYMGWRSHELTGPYWGRMGRSAGWEESGQGFRNFQLDTHYLGVIPILFALWACWGGWRYRKRLTHVRKDLVFWSAVALLTLLLSFGKYCFLYKIFYMLPVVSSIRAPVKFLQVFQLALGVLSAYGLEMVSGQIRERIGSFSKERFFFWSMAGCTLLLICTYFWTRSFSSEIITNLSSDGWVSEAGVIVKNRIQALAHAVIMAVGILAGLWFFFFSHLGTKASYRQKVAWVLVSVVILDLFLLSKHYVKSVNTRMFQENGVVRTLQSDPKSFQRVAMTTQAGFYNHWLTYLFPYHNIKTFNFAQMPRMPVDYKKFLTAMNSNALRMWQLCSVEYIMGPSQLWQQVQRNPGWKELFELAYVYNVYSDGKGGIEVVGATEKQPGQHCIVRQKKALPRFSLIGTWDVLSDEDVLKQLPANERNIHEKVSMAPEAADLLPPSPETSAEGHISIEEYRPGTVTLNISAKQPVILKMADRYTPRWKAFLDGRQVPVLRCDYIFSGVLIGPGIHELVLKHETSRFPLLIQSLGLLLCAIVVGGLVYKKIAKKGEVVP